MQLVQDNTNHFNIYFKTIQITLIFISCIYTCISDSLLYFVSESSTCGIYILHRDVVSCSTCNSASGSVHLYIKQYAVCINLTTKCVNLTKRSW